MLFPNAQTVPIPRSSGEEIAHFSNKCWECMPGIMVKLPKGRFRSTGVKTCASASAEGHGWQHSRQDACLGDASKQCRDRPEPMGQPIHIEKPTMQLSPVHLLSCGDRQTFCGKPRFRPPWLGSSQRVVITLPRVKKWKPSTPWAWVSPNSEFFQPPKE